MPPPAPTAVKRASERSLDSFKRQTSLAFTLNLLPPRGPKMLYSGTDAIAPTAEPADFAVGSDQSVGGLTTARLTAVPAAGAQAGTSHLAFHGIMSLKMPPLLAGRIRPGFASFRNARRSSLLGEEYWDLDHHSHLRIVAAYRGWEGWRRRWVCTFQTDGPVESDLFQHRLDLGVSPTANSSEAELNPLDPSGLRFTTIHVPLDAFVMTNHGRPLPKQIAPMLEKVRSVGFSLLGGGRGEEILPTVQPGAIDLLRRSRGAGRGRAEVSTGAAFPPAGLEEDELDVSPFVDPEQPLSRFQDQHAAQQPQRVYDNSINSTGLQPHEGTEAYFELCIKSVEAVYLDPDTMQIQETETVQPSSTLF